MTGLLGLSMFLELQRPPPASPRPPLISLLRGLPKSTRKLPAEAARDDTLKLDGQEDLWEEVEMGMAPFLCSG